MKRILVPCDFSTPAVHAFQFALDIATQSKGKVHLLNVVELPVLHDTLLMPTLNFEEALLKDLRDEAKKSFKKITEKYDGQDVEVTSTVAFGPVYARVVEYINEHDIDLVVMGSHGANGAREFFVGSNAEKIVRNAPAPVLIMKDYYKGPIKHIVFPNKFDAEPQETLVMKIRELQSFFKAHLHLVWINTPINFTSDVVTFKRMEEFAKEFGLTNYTLSVFNARDEEEGIIQFANKVKADMIAMATHGRKGISHLLNGSLAEDLANHHKGLIWTYSLKNEAIEV